ncbi:MAG: SUMF1/EgtB/PvdO family nonheme iron enzyme, partial [Phycisphaerales bacterium]|nr:SUMF1/EgtB/PvdO family nonheme iron enzyme [Phycisphaerales bacterium]
MRSKFYLTGTVLLLMLVSVSSAAPKKKANSLPAKAISSKILRGGGAAGQTLTVDVSGWTDLYLMATIGGDSFRSDQAIWGNPMLTDTDGDTASLTTLKPSKVQVGWGKLLKNKNYQDLPLLIGKTAYAKGFWAHGPSLLHFKLGGKYKSFTTDVGIDAGAGEVASCQFVISPTRPNFLAAKHAKGSKGKKPAPSEKPAKARPAGLGEWKLDPASIKAAIEELETTFASDYPNAEDYLSKLEAITAAIKDNTPTAAQTKALRALQTKALLANPLLSCQKLMLVRRKGPAMGLTNNWKSNSSISRKGFRDELVVLSPIAPGGKYTSLYKSPRGSAITDVDLEFDGDKVMFSAVNAKNRWTLFEMNLATKAVVELKLTSEADVDNYDSCYLPSGDILFQSTATYLGVPCVYGSSHVTNTYKLTRTTGKIRQLTFDQEHNWNQNVMPNGRILYQRWEYSDLPHSNSRFLMQMNPDGTGQAEFYGSGSYFPNSIFYPRVMPGTTNKVVGIATGHHGTMRSGRMIVFDPKVGTRENTGCVHEFPYSKRPVTRKIADRLVDGDWPKFLHPFPLSESHVIAVAQLSPRSPWGVYLVDTHDNMVLIKTTEGGLIPVEPILLQKTKRPPVIPTKVDLTQKHANVYLADIYTGPGLKGVERGTVKQLRLITYHFGPRDFGGLYGSIGLDGPWDIKRVIGTVPVEPDGSASFKIPANLPISLQPLDKDGQALQVMRSWFVGMPGENVSCVGCHEPSTQVAPVSVTVASRRAPDDMSKWRPKDYNFSFSREIQPILDRRCVGCHDGTKAGRPYFKGDTKFKWKSDLKGNVGYKIAGDRWTQSYYDLHLYVRQPGIESDLQTLKAMEFTADGSELIQILRKGHHGVELSAKEYRSIFTWIDLNTPYYGNWSEMIGAKKAVAMTKKGRAARAKYAPGFDIDYEGGLPPIPKNIKFEKPTGKKPPKLAIPTLNGWPLNTANAKAKQLAAAKALGLAKPEKLIKLPNGDTVKLVLIPAGTFVMGSATHASEAPKVVTIDNPFWISATEITNTQYKAFAPNHDSREESRHGYQFGVLGFQTQRDNQPVVRVSHTEAMAFCTWLAKKTNT